MAEATKVAPEETKATKKTTKSKTTKAKTPTKTTTKTVEKGTRTLYYAYSVGCGWCKKTDPIIDELNKDGYNIQKLDLAVPDNQTVINEVKQKYNQTCGTPYLVDADTGNMICGFREKDVVEKWANGEEIPQPPRPKSPPPRPPFHGAAEEEVTTWKHTYTDWLKENDHLPDNQKRSADDILAMPRPKSDPPRPPQPNAAAEELDKWAIEYDTWRTDNSQMPNLQPAATILDRWKAQQPNWRGSNVNTPDTIDNTKTPPSTSGNKSLNTEFYYVVEGSRDVAVYAEEAYIRSLEHNYYIRENSGKLTKVVDAV